MPDDSRERIERGEAPTPPERDRTNDEFFAKADRALRVLFERAKAAHELHFAMALMPEFRGSQDPGWNTAHEAVRAYDEFIELLGRMEARTSIRLRVMLAFYLHVAEGSGFYGIPKTMLLTIEGRGNNIFPFSHLVERHRLTGEVIAPNANQIMKDLIGHASELGLSDLAEVLRDAFDSDVRNAVAHADYIIWTDGLRLPRRDGGRYREIPYPELVPLLERGVNLFSYIRELTVHYARSYDPPKRIRARLHPREPECHWTIFYNPKNGTFGITTGEP